MPHRCLPKREGSVVVWTTICSFVEKKRRRASEKKILRERYQKRERKGGKNLEKKAHLFVAEEEEEEVRRRRAVVHVDDANANDDAMFVSFSFCCVVDDERESDHLFFDDARCSISFAERKNANFF